MATLTRFVNPNSTAGGDGTTNATAGANRAYVSLSAWEAAQQQDLDTGNNIAECICETGGTADTTAVTIDGWTTSATDYIDIKTSSGHRHAGVWNTAKYLLEAAPAGTGVLIIAEDFVRLTGLQVRWINGTPGTNASAVRTSGTFGATADIRVESCILREGRYTVRNDGACALLLRNTVIYGNTVGGAVATAASTACVLTAENCTVIGVTNGIQDAAAAATLVGRNTYAAGTTAFSAMTTMTTCASSDTTGSAGLQNVAHSTANFTNVTAGSEDYHLVTGSALIDVGTDLSGSFTTDIDGATRSGTWDIGADEFVTAGGTFTATATLAGGSSTLAATAAFTAPTYTASAALSGVASTLAATATHTTPVYTATGALTSVVSILAVTAAFTAPVYTAVGALTSGVTTLASTATFGTGHTATAALSGGQSTLAASAEFTSPVYTAVGELTAGGTLLAASATFAAPVYTATAALASLSTVLAATAVFTEAGGEVVSGDLFVFAGPDGAFALSL